MAYCNECNKKANYYVRCLEIKKGVYLCSNCYLKSIIAVLKEIVTEKIEIE